MGDDFEVDGFLGNGENGRMGDGFEVDGFLGNGENGRNGENGMNG